MCQTNCKSENCLECVESPRHHHVASDDEKRHVLRHERGRHVVWLFRQQPCQLRGRRHPRHPPWRQRWRNPLPQKGWRIDGSFNQPDLLRDQVLSVQDSGQTWPDAVGNVPWRGTFIPAAITILHFKSDYQRLTLLVDFRWIWEQWQTCSTSMATRTVTRPAAGLVPRWARPLHA